MGKQFLLYFSRAAISGLFLFSTSFALAQNETSEIYVQRAQLWSQVYQTFGSAGPIAVFNQAVNPLERFDLAKQSQVELTEKEIANLEGLLGNSIETARAQLKEMLRNEGFDQVEISINQEASEHEIQKVLKEAVIRGATKDSKKAYRIISHTTKLLLASTAVSTSLIFLPHVGPIIGLGAFFGSFFYLISIRVKSDDQAGRLEAILRNFDKSDAAKTLRKYLNLLGLQKLLRTSYPESAKTCRYKIMGDG